MIEPVRAWRDRLRAVDPAPWRGLLSAEGARTVWHEALDALTDEALVAAAALPGRPWATAAMAVPRTVPTAPLEWCAVWLTRGTAVTLKPPSGSVSLVAPMVEAARAVGLPLRASSDRGALVDAELAVVQGGDEAVAAVRAARGARPTLGFGHRFSVAWVRRTPSMAGVAADAARFDGRGCMSPVAVFTDLPLEVAGAALAEAMSVEAARIPRGELTATEGASWREHVARARARGGLVAGAGWAVLAGPVPEDEPVGLVRGLHLLRVADLAAFRAWCRRWPDRLSTVGTDDPELSSLPETRICPPGAMQRPPLHRLHDGLDWVALASRSGEGQPIWGRR